MDKSIDSYIRDAGVADDDEEGVARALEQMLADADILNTDEGGRTHCRQSRQDQHAHLEIRLSFVKYVEGKFAILWRQKSPWVSHCLEYDLPSTPFDLAGLGARICSYLSIRVAVKKGRAVGKEAITDASAVNKVCARTVKKWRDMLITVVIAELKQGKTVGELAEILGTKRSKSSKGLIPLVNDHVVWLIESQRLCWETGKEAFVYGKEEVRIMVNELYRDFCAGESDPHRTLDVTGASLLGVNTGNRPGAIVAGNKLDVGVRDRGLCTSEVKWVRAAVVDAEGNVEDFDAWSTWFKITHHKFSNVPGEQKARKWVLHPFEQAGNLFLEAGLPVLISVMERGLLQAVGGPIIRNPQELFASSATDFVGIGDRIPTFASSCRSKYAAMDVHSLTDHLDRVSARVNMPAHSMSYVRRDFGTYSRAVYGTDDARELMNHGQQRNVIGNVYSGGWTADPQAFVKKLARSHARTTNAASAHKLSLFNTDVPRAHSPASAPLLPRLARSSSHRLVAMASPLQLNVDFYEGEDADTAACYGADEGEKQRRAHNKKVAERLRLAVERNPLADVDLTEAKLVKQASAVVKRSLFGVIIAHPDGRTEQPLCSRRPPYATIDPIVSAERSSEPQPDSEPPRSLEPQRSREQYQEQPQQERSDVDRLADAFVALIIEARNRQLAGVPAHKWLFEVPEDELRQAVRELIARATAAGRKMLDALLRGGQGGIEAFVSRDFWRDHIAPHRLNKTMKVSEIRRADNAEALDTHQPAEEEGVYVWEGVGNGVLVAR